MSSSSINPSNGAISLCIHIFLLKSPWTIMFALLSVVTLKLVEENGIFSDQFTVNLLALKKKKKTS